MGQTLLLSHPRTGKKRRQVLAPPRLGLALRALLLEALSLRPSLFLSQLVQKRLFYEDKNRTRSPRSQPNSRKILIEWQANSYSGIEVVNRLFNMNFLSL